MLRLTDDAMAPDGLHKGLTVIWDTRRQPRFGKAVLVRDGFGQLHVRRYTQGRAPGAWVAVSPNPAYTTLDSEIDGLSVVAAILGQLEPDEEHA